MDFRHHMVTYSICTVFWWIGFSMKLNLTNYSKIRFNRTEILDSIDNLCFDLVKSPWTCINLGLSGYFFKMLAHHLSLRNINCAISGSTYHCNFMLFILGSLWNWKMPLLTKSNSWILIGMFKRNKNFHSGKNTFIWS